MSRFKDWVMQLSIRKKLIFYSYLVITPILLFISILLFWNNYQTALREEKASCAQSVQSLSDSIEVVQNNIIKMGVYISINNEIMQILTSDKPEKLNQDAQLWFHDAPLQIIQDMVAIDGQIKTIAIYPENGVNPYLRGIDRSSYIGDFEKVQNEAIYELAVREKGKFLWQRVGKNPSETYQSNSDDKIVMYREIYDLSRNNKLGYLVIGTSAEVFDQISRNALQNDREAIMIISEYGSELVRYGDIPEDIFLSVSNELIDWAEDGKLNSGVCQGYRVYRYQSQDTGTIVYKIVPKVGISDFAASIIYSPLALLLGFLIGLCPIMILVSNLVSKPLHTLRIAMENFKKGDFEQKVQVTTMDEVGEAVACFNDMVDAIRDLINKNYVMALKEKESELDVLQAQINPHFLYNTLDSLYWKAIEEENEEIAEDIISLSHLFRFVLNRGNSIITVRNEAELLESYLHIQKMRFGKRLEYQVYMEEDILEEEIPKLILQPFVENAIIHGFEKGEHKFNLSVDGRRDGSSISFQICDNGIGMSREQLASIWIKKDSIQQSGQRIGKYAIRNVRERLELLYQEDYELKIDSEEGKGTAVMISIPCGLKEIKS